MYDKNDEKKPVKYYGKKAYTINPQLVRKKIVGEASNSEYKYQDIDEKEAAKRR